MDNESILGKISYSALKIVNCINFVLLSGLLIGNFNLNRYVSFILLLLIASLTVIISRNLLNAMIVNKGVNLESTFAFKIVSILSIASFLGYLIYRNDWVLVILLIVFISLFALVLNVRKIIK